MAGAKPRHGATIISGLAKLTVFLAKQKCVFQGGLSESDNLLNI